MGASGKVDANEVLMRHGPDRLREIMDDQIVAAQSARVAKKADKPSGDKGNPRAKPADVKATPFVFRDPSLIARRDWLYGRHYIRNFVSMTIAPGGVGKSSLVIAEVLAMVTGRRLLYDTPRKPLRVWLWNGEDPRDELERRIAAICLHFGITPEEVADRLFVDSGRDMEIKIAKSGRNGPDIAHPVVDGIIRTIRENGIDLLVVDPFVSSHAVNENDNAAIDAVAKKFAYIAEHAGCAVELVHHVRKSPNTPAHEMTADDARGASALTATARTVRIVQKMTKDEAESRAIEQHWQYFQTVDGKANLAPPASEAIWYQLRNVELPNGSIDEPGDSIGVVVRWNYPSLTETLPPNVLKQVQEKVGSGEYREHPQAREWVGHALGKLCNLDSHDKGQSKKLDRLIRQWVENGVLRVVRRKGADRHEANFIEVGDPV